MQDCPEDTRSRIVAAARCEFVQHGLAGARVERIAASASANKASIYRYFSSKDALFDEVLSDTIGSLLAVAHWDPDDVASYAARICDAVAEDPGIYRLIMWARMQRDGADPLDVESYRRNRELIDPMFGDDGPTVVALLNAIGMSWPAAPRGIRANSPEPEDSPERRSHHRMIVVGSAREIVERALTH